MSFLAPSLSGQQHLNHNHLMYTALDTYYEISQNERASHAFRLFHANKRQVTYYHALSKTQETQKEVTIVQEQKMQQRHQISSSKSFLVLITYLPYTLAQQSLKYFSVYK